MKYTTQEQKALERLLRELKRRPDLAKAQRSFVEYHLERRRQQDQLNRRIEFDRLMNEMSARNTHIPEHKRRIKFLEKEMKNSLPYY